MNAYFPAVVPDEEVQKNISKVEDAEIGENLDFERHWSKVQNVAWIVFAAFLVGGLLGVFGKGPLAKATAGTSQDPFYAQYDRFARYMTTSNLRFVITPSARIENGAAQVFISEDFVKTLRTEHINPHPLWAQLSRGGVVFGFKATPGANMTIQFVQTPQKFGAMTSQLGLANETLLEISQFIYPAGERPIRMGTILRATLLYWFMLFILRLSLEGPETSSRLSSLF